MPTVRDLTPKQKEQLKKLLLKQKDWEHQKKQIKTAKVKSKAKTKKT